MEAEDKNPLVILAEVMDYDSSSITVREGKKLLVNCVCERSDVAHKSDIFWKKAGGNPIDGETTPSLFSILVKEKNTGYKKASLHFGSVHPRDTGLYTCVVRTVGGQIFEKSVQINVLPKLEWNNSDVLIGALVGDPITVDCGVRQKTEHESQVTLTSGTGEPLNETIFTIAGHEATIESVTKAHKDLVVSCVHIEMHPEPSGEEFPVVDRKDVRIDVYSAPEFSTDEAIQYTVIDNHFREVKLFCNITASHPIPKQYTFYHNDQLITYSQKHMLYHYSSPIHGAYLKIRDVNEHDLGTYKCEVYNGKTKSVLKIHLREANPPSEPKVTLISSHKHSMQWKIETDGKKPDLPVKFVEIRHLRAQQADGTGVSDDEIDDSFWEGHSIKIEKPINEEGIYEIGGLRHAHEYVWRFRLISEAGFGESVVVRAKTFDELDLAAYTSSAAQTAFLSFVSIIFVFFILH
ncbi:unnamed protein product [Caenorhabditis bovis]|uniref:Ig-like domain-containing protein n=1 Tax=Caenorhabditis bovis TaxID=2654633 RepID=A0A8S1EQZ7_9PELO|nr:unnamed protein product [Caenorhabditis bovis]